MEKDQSLTPCIIDKVALNANGHFQAERRLSRVSPPNHPSSADQELDMAFTPWRNWRDRTPSQFSFSTEFFCFNMEFQGQEGEPFW